MCNLPILLHCLKSVCCMFCLLHAFFSQRLLFGEHRMPYISYMFCKTRMCDFGVTFWCCSISCWYCGIHAQFCSPCRFLRLCFMLFVLCLTRVLCLLCCLLRPPPLCVSCLRYSPLLKCMFSVPCPLFLHGLLRCMLLTASLHQTGCNPHLQSGVQRLVLLVCTQL